MVNLTIYFSITFAGVAVSIDIVGSPGDISVYEGENATVLWHLSNVTKEILMYIKTKNGREIIVCGYNSPESNDKNFHVEGDCENTFGFMVTNAKQSMSGVYYLVRDTFRDSSHLVVLGK